MTDTATARLGVGATVVAHRNLWAWAEFFSAMQRRLPEALAALASIAARPGTVQIQSGRLDDDTERELNRWASKWGVPSSEDEPHGRWCLKQLRTHVLMWRKHPGLAGRWLAFDDVGSRQRWELRWVGDQFDVGPPTIGWVPEDETEESFRRRVEEYIDRMKGLPGTVPTPTVQFCERAFDAFVLEHCAELTMTAVLERLSDADGGDATNTRKRNTRLADLLGIRIRRRPRGKPGNSVSAPR